jgi:hypothetical protein
VVGRMLHTDSVSTAVTATLFSGFAEGAGKDVWIGDIT